MRGLEWLSSVGFGGRCELRSKGGSLVRGEIQRHGGGGGRRDGSGGDHERGHLAFPREGDGRREERRLIEREWGSPGNEMEIPPEQEEE